MTLRTHCHCPPVVMLELERSVSLVRDMALRKEGSPGDERKQTKINFQFTSVAAVEE